MCGCIIRKGYWIPYITLINEYPDELFVVLEDWEIVSVTVTDNNEMDI